MKVPTILRQAIDPSKDIDAQYEARFKAVLTLLGVPWESENDDQILLIRLMIASFPKALAGAIANKC